MVKILRDRFVMAKIPVLMYHSLQPRDGKGSGCRYEIKEQDFEKQMEFLVSSGYSSLLFKDIALAKKIPSKGIIITLDDGHLSNYTVAFPILRKLGLKAEFFITSGQVTQNNRMNVSQLREMLAQGMGIGCHGLTHAYLDDLDDAEAKKELCQSKEDLSNMLGKAVYAFSAPGGRFQEKHIQMAKDCGYRVFCTSRPGCIGPHTSLLKVPRMPVCQNNLLDFSRIVGADIYYYFKRCGLVFFADIAKKILGNRRYETIRHFLPQ